MTHNLQRNLKITCSWNGKDFSGFQIQPHAHTIEGTLNKAWRILAGSDERVNGCSRLDAGVHAYHYVFNIFSKTKFSCERIVKSLNGILHDNLSADICIYACEDVDHTFHARFSAIGKHYQYLIWAGFAEHVDFRHRAWHVKTKFSLENLGSILKEFEGTHDFNSFRASDCGAKNSIKTIHKITVSQHKDFPELYVIDVFGDGFLKNMIRNIVGMGMLVINQKKELGDIAMRLKTGKKEYNLCAPAHALTLMQVYYLPMQNVENIS